MITKTLRMVCLPPILLLSVVNSKEVSLSDQETPADEKLPLEVLSRFNGKTREDLIKVLVTQQATIETQGKKITDLEAYIDTLLSKVMDVAPVVLQKDIRNANRFKVLKI